MTAPEELKVARFVARAARGEVLTGVEREALEAEAQRRMAQQISDEAKAAMSDYVLANSGALSELEWQVDQLWPICRSRPRSSPDRAVCARKSLQ